MTRQVVRLARQLDLPFSVSVANGQTISESFGVGPSTAGGFQTPSALTSTTVTFQVSHDGQTWVTLYNDVGVAISRTVSASGGFPLPFELFLHYFARFIMGSAEGAAREIYVTLNT